MSHVLDVADLRDRVYKVLAGFLAAQRASLEVISEDLGPAADRVQEFVLDGGKRLRPAFCYWGWRGAGGPDTDEIVSAAASLELLQACALIHDDVMDGSDTRRGRPALHRGFATMHRSAGWDGDAETFGTSAAILLGDLCLIWADQLLNTSGLASDVIHRAAPTYDEMRVEVMAGQYLDLLEQVLGGRDVEHARRVARYKSAKYTVERPLHLGGVLAGAPPDVLATYTRYGLPLGEAFQLRDDLLGVFGDPGETGKPAGDDLREGKRTVLVAITLRRAGPGEAEVVRRHLGDPHLDDAGVAELQTAITDSGARAEVEGLIERLTGESVAALHSGGLPDDSRRVLAELAVAATSRLS